LFYIYGIINQNNQIMRKIIIVILVIATFGMTSCEKEEFGSYTTAPPTPPDTTTTTTYANGGTANFGGGNLNNELVGTQWVITKYVLGFNTADTPFDTLDFVSNTHYTVNGGAVRTYTLSGITGSNNKSLTLNFLMTLGGGIYSGQVGKYFVSDGLIVAATFLDVDQNSKVFKVWMEKQ
jgi:hypothetical protein